MKSLYPKERELGEVSSAIALMSSRDGGRSSFRADFYDQAVAWEHLYCGKIYETATPPTICLYCSTVTRVLKGREVGWRKVQPAEATRRKKKKRKRSGRRGGARIGPERRLKLYARDDWKCVSCGEDDERLLTLDHKVPRSKGGDNSDENLQTMCKGCNHRKADKMPDSSAMARALHKAGLV